MSQTGVAETTALLGSAPARFLKELDPMKSRVLAHDLKALPAIEQVSGTGLVLAGLPRDYRAVAVPSGYMVMYRHLTDVEKKERHQPVDQDVVLVADIQPLVK
ncbi:MAG: hypothetical protein ACLQPH_05890 [Acidimicrobiales bacterium]